MMKWRQQCNCSTFDSIECIKKKNYKKNEHIRQIIRTHVQDKCANILFLIHRDREAIRG